MLLKHHDTVATSIKHPILHRGSLCFGSRQTKRISDEAFVVGDIPPSAAAFPGDRQLNSQGWWICSATSECLQTEKWQGRRNRYLHSTETEISELGCSEPLERRYELCLAPQYPFAAAPCTEVLLVQQRRGNWGHWTPELQTPHFSELLFRLLARPSRTPWKLVLNAPSRRHTLIVIQLKH